jgi:hypothetical protein
VILILDTSYKASNILNMPTKDEFKKLLKDTVVTVNFKKKDDSLRKMICTLNEDYLPEPEERENKKVKSESNDAIAVWDLEKQAWRSFRLDSIVNYETNH